MGEVAGGGDGEHVGAQLGGHGNGHLYHKNGKKSWSYKSCNYYNTVSFSLCYQNGDN